MTVRRTGSFQRKGDQDVPVLRCIPLICGWSCHWYNQGMTIGTKDAGRFSYRNAEIIAKRTVLQLLLLTAGYDARRPAIAMECPR